MFYHFYFDICHTNICNVLSCKQMYIIFVPFFHSTVFFVWYMYVLRYCTCKCFICLHFSQLSCILDNLFFFFFSLSDVVNKYIYRFTFDFFWWPVHSQILCNIPNPDLNSACPYSVCQMIERSRLREYAFSPFSSILQVN